MKPPAILNRGDLVDVDVGRDRKQVDAQQLVPHVQADHRGGTSVGDLGASLIVQERQEGWRIRIERLSPGVDRAQAGARFLAG